MKVKIPRSSYMEIKRMTDDSYFPDSIEIEAEVSDQKCHRCYEERINGYAWGIVVGFVLMIAGIFIGLKF